MSRSITVNDIEVQVVRKNIRNLRLVVSPPEGRVRVSVPAHVSEDEVRLLVVAKLSWIKKHQARFRARPRPAQVEMVSGEGHYLFGKRYRLDVIERHGSHKVVLEDDTTLAMYVRPETAAHKRVQLLDQWYREQLKHHIPGLIDKWEPVIGRQVSVWGVRKMKTRWGSCNITKSRIWLNLELAKKPMECLEYVLVHEMVHLHERYHNQNFKNYMDRFLPQWREIKGVLNSEPLECEARGSRV